MMDWKDFYEEREYRRAIEAGEIVPAVPKDDDTDVRDEEAAEAHAEKWADLMLEETLLDF